MIWPAIKFSEAISRSGLFSDGDWVESKDQDPEGDVRLIQLADIGVGEFVNKSNRFMTSKRADELKCSYLQAGDILVARMPDPIGRACIFPEDMGRCVTVVDICIVRPDSERIDNRWLMHLINSERFRNQIDRHVTGTTRQRISRGNLAGLEIPLPPLPEQKRIAAILDKAEAILRKRQHAIQLADDFLRAVFLDMFGDPGANPKGFNEAVLGELTTGKMNNGLFRKNDEYGGSVPVAWVGELFRGNRISFSEDASRIEPTEKEIDAYGLKYGDLLFCRSSLRLEGIGFNNIYLGDDDNALFECHLIRMSPCLEKVNPVFLNYQLRMPSVRARIFQQAKTSTMTTIDQAGLSRIKVFVPPLDLQEEFERRLIKVESLYSHLYKNKSLDELVFSSISQKAFSGQL
ncbi:restriction endonuclease subunit S [Pseudomonas pudica]|uniref:Restriction endonuclease subunit S n=1 Tax=Pseudomonas pudica TaxID=272772 RepID=A0ABS0FY94_9PSED|nr:restriction endonuclease subunit S [Pseudomonas pudica]MBF8645315.1 restriction endonuclease subunit S [Pseudomonas pudica]MBF8759795.1 restriction endonuclease subunit S [Pseudomonas pudica]